jgi:hypothetical protein
MHQMSTLKFCMNTMMILRGGENTWNASLKAVEKSLKRLAICMIICVYTLEIGHSSVITHTAINHSHRMETSQNIFAYIQAKSCTPAIYAGRVITNVIASKFICLKAIILKITLNKNKYELLIINKLNYLSSSLILHQQV